MLSAGLRQAFFRLARGKTQFALLVVALGTTLGAVFCSLSFAYLVNSQPLPYPQQERLVVAEQLILDRGGNPNSRGLSYPAIALLHREAHGVLSPAAMIDHARDVVVSHPAQPLVALTYATAEYAELFKPPMAKGRFPTNGWGADITQPVAVISHSAWQSLFDLREDVLGQSVRTAAGVDFEVIGVTARDFVEPEFHGPGHRTQVWLPWAFQPSLRQWGWAATTETLTLAGRLAPGVSERQAAERLSFLLNARWREELSAASDSHAGWSTRVELLGAQRAIAGDGVAVGPLMLAATLGLLLVALVNVTHLLVARVAERSREFAIHLALGSTPKHLFVLILADMLLLMLPAGVVALLVAAAGIAVMQRTLGSMLPRLDELSVEWPMVAMTMVLVVLLALLLAAIALASITRSSAIGGLNAGRHGTAPRVSRRFRAVLMASQVGIAGLLIAANVGLFREAYRVLDEEGIELERTASAYLYRSAAAGMDDAALEHTLGQIRRRLADLPGVEKVSQSHSPLQDFIKTVFVSGRSGGQYPVELKRIDHQYFGITGQKLALGRNISGSDVQRTAQVAIVNAAFARTLEAEGGALGARLSRGGAEPHTVVGVVDELAYPGASIGSPRVYLPASEAGSNFIITFRPGQHMSREQLVAFIASVNPAFGVFLYDDLDEQRSGILLPRRITAVSTLFVGLLVILVSGMGLYGMIRYTTRLIRAEIGTRLAFGARPYHILRLLVTSNLAALLSGCVVSLVIALLLLPGLHARIDPRLFELRWMDGAVALAFLGVLALLACYLSARPVLSESPASALREP